MDVDRETIVEIVLSVVAVLGFIGAVLLLGMTYGAEGLGEQGGRFLVGLIVAFILGMGAAGYWLSAREA